MGRRGNERGSGGKERGLVRRQGGGEGKRVTRLEEIDDLLGEGEGFAALPSLEPDLHFAAADAFLQLIGRACEVDLNELRFSGFQDGFGLLDDFALACAAADREKDAIGGKDHFCACFSRYRAFDMDNGC